MGFSDVVVDCPGITEVLIWLNAGFGANALATIMAVASVRFIATSL